MLKLEHKPEKSLVDDVEAALDDRAVGEVANVARVNVAVEI